MPDYTALRNELVAAFAALTNVDVSEDTLTYLQSQVMQYVSYDYVAALRGNYSAAARTYLRAAPRDMLHVVLEYVQHDPMYSHSFIEELRGKDMCSIYGVPHFPNGVHVGGNIMYVEHGDCVLKRGSSNYIAERGGYRHYNLHGAAKQESESFIRSISNKIGDIGRPAVVHIIRGAVDIVRLRYYIHGIHTATTTLRFEGGIATVNTSYMWCFSHYTTELYDFASLQKRERIDIIARLGRRF